MDFLEHFAELEDGRVDINIDHNLLDVVFLTIAAFTCGAEGWKDVQEFGDASLPWLRQFRPFAHGIPRRHTIARIIKALEPDNLLACFVSWVNAVREHKGQPHIAIDGKSLRGSATADGNMLHLVSAMVVDSGLVIYQKPSEGKGNEIKTVQSLLDVLDIKGACVTLDALHCQTATVAKLVARQADYVVQVKGNQKASQKEIEAYFHKVRRDDGARITTNTREESDKGHGRLEQRRYVCLKPCEWLSCGDKWCGLARIVEVTRCTQLSNGERREEISYYITSLSDIEQIAARIRGHWAIENRQHYVLDVAYREDDSRVRVGNGPENLALFRRFALNLARQSPVNDSMKSKLKRAAWNESFRTELLFGQLDG
jgi:predicted transposase YbfD/YdcC